MNLWDLIIMKSYKNKKEMIEIIRKNFPELLERDPTKMYLLRSDIYFLMSSSEGREFIKYVKKELPEVLSTIEFYLMKFPETVEEVLMADVVLTLELADIIGREDLKKRIENSVKTLVRDGRRVSDAIDVYDKLSKHIRGLKDVILEGVRNAIRKVRNGEISYVFELFEVYKKSKIRNLTIKILEEFLSKEIKEILRNIIERCKDEKDLENLLSILYNYITLEVSGMRLDRKFIKELCERMIEKEKKIKGITFWIYQVRTARYKEEIIEYVWSYEENPSKEKS